MLLPTSFHVHFALDDSLTARVKVPLENSVTFHFYRVFYCPEPFGSRKRLFRLLYIDKYGVLFFILSAIVSRLSIVPLFIKFRARLLTRAT